MKLNSIIYRYIFLELIPPFIINVLFFTFIFLLTRILEITNMIVNYKVGIKQVGLMLVYTVPYFLVFVFPMAAMMAVLLTFLRMSGDNEIIALKSGGVNLYQLLPPVLIFCALVSIATGYMIIQGLPWGRQSLKQLTVKLASSHLDVGIKERTFNDTFKDVMLYVNRVDLKHRTLVDVFIEDRRNRKLIVTIMAPEGKLVSEADQPVFHLVLKNGIINQVNLQEKSFNTLRFDAYEMNLDLRKVVMAASSGQKGEKEMSLSELWDYIHQDVPKDERYWNILLEFHRKFSIPFACIVLGMVAMPLGIASRFTKRSFGLGLGLAFFLFYYLMLSAGFVFGEAGKYPPILGMWMPNIVTGAMAIYLIRKTVREESPIRLDIFFLRIRNGIVAIYKKIHWVQDKV